VAEPDAKVWISERIPTASLNASDRYDKSRSTWNASCQRGFTIRWPRTEIRSQYNLLVGFSPDDADALLATAAQALALQGASREVEILAYSDAEFEESGYDNWNGGQTLFTLQIRLSSRLYEQITASRELLEKSILATLQEVFRRYESDHITAVHIHRALNTNKSWKADAQKWLKGENVNNQGRVRSDNIAPLEKDGLLFRSRPEMFLYDALKQLGVPIAPLPVFVQGGASYQRIEPDLVVVNQGLMMVVEVDGDTSHSELPAVASARLEMLTSHGIQVKRVRADECSSPERAASCARNILEYMGKLKNSRL
jgi:hypothetical protein